MRTVTVSTLLICATLSWVGQTGHEPETFFRKYIGLQDDQIADIQP